MIAYAAAVERRGAGGHPRAPGPQRARLAQALRDRRQGAAPHDRGVRSGAAGSSGRSTTPIPTPSPTRPRPTSTSPPTGRALEWVIVGLAGEQPDVRCYLIEDGARARARARGRAEWPAKSSARAACSPTARSSASATPAGCRSCTPNAASRTPARAAAAGARSTPSTPRAALVKVARAANLVQAEFLAGMLLEEGIPCMLSSAPARSSPCTRPSPAPATCWCPNPRSRRPAKRSPAAPSDGPLQRPAEPGRSRPARRGPAGRRRW